MVSSDLNRDVGSEVQKREREKNGEVVIRGEIGWGVV